MAAAGRGILRGYDPRPPGDHRTPRLPGRHHGHGRLGRLRLGGATLAAALLAEDGDTLATFDSDRIYDYRARRPTLEIVNGMPRELTWPELKLVRRRLDGRDVLVLTGPEPDYRWQQLGAELAQLARMLEVRSGSAWVPSPRPCPTPVP